MRRPRLRRFHDDEQGTLIPWLIGLVLILFAFGGLSVDLWHAHAERRAVAGAVDSAVIAGASAIDDSHLRTTGERRLDPARARQLAAQNLASHSGTIDSYTITVAPDGSQITVAAATTVRLTLASLVSDDDRREVAAEATSTPRRAP